MDLTEFLTARWDGEACVAEAAQARHPSPWRDEHEHELGPGHVYDSQGGEVFDNSGGHLGSSHPGAVHIASWDPAHVLAEIAVKRAILALHENDSGECTSCIYAVGSESSATDDDVVGFYEDYPCPHLRLLAQPHRNHPDFDPTWSAPT